MAGKKSRYYPPNKEEVIFQGPWHPVRDGIKWTVANAGRFEMVELSFWRYRSAVSMTHALNAVYIDGKHDAIRQFNNEGTSFDAHRIA